MRLWLLLLLLLRLRPMLVLLLLLVVALMLVLVLVLLLLLPPLLPLLRLMLLRPPDASIAVSISSAMGDSVDWEGLEDPVTWELMLQLAALEEDERQFQEAVETAEILAHEAKEEPQGATPTTGDPVIVAPALVTWDPAVPWPDWIWPAMPITPELKETCTTRAYRPLIPEETAVASPEAAAAAGWSWKTWWEWRQVGMVGLRAEPVWVLWGGWRELLPWKFGSESRDGKWLVGENGPRVLDWMYVTPPSAVAWGAVRAAITAATEAATAAVAAVAAAEAAMDAMDVDEWE